MREIDEYKRRKGQIYRAVRDDLRRNIVDEEESIIEDIRASIERL